MTILFLVISFVAGIALGQRFKILILVPVMSLALVGTIAAGVARADNVWSIVIGPSAAERLVRRTEFAWQHEPPR